MYNFISIFIKCPSCGKSLMDHNKKVDNEPSISLIIKEGEHKGLIWLSSIYGSYNFISEIEIGKDAVAEFYCPHCKSNLGSDDNCKACDAPMIDFNLDMGGRVSICSRNGCQNHAVEFEDLSLALKKLYQEYGYGGKKYPKSLDLRTEADPEEKKPSETAEILETGTFLNAYCPHCRKSLIEHDMLKLKIINGEEGFLMLSPYLNVFTSKSTIFLPEDKMVTDIKCPHCDKSLISQRECKKCGSPAAKISISARTKFIDFYVCTKKGCRWHGLCEEDLYEIRLEDSDEW